MICFDDQCSSARGCSLCVSLICSKRGAADSIVSLKSSSHSFIERCPLLKWHRLQSVISLSDIGSQTEVCATYSITTFRGPSLTRPISKQLNPQSRTSDVI